MKITSVAMWVAGLVAWVGCGGSDDPATPSGQAGQGGSAGGSLLIACGSSDLFAQAHASCDAMDAVGAPDDSGAQCRCMIGFAWDGTACVALGGCACKGADCDKLTQTIEECRKNHAVCMPDPQFVACGSSTLYSAKHDRCSAMDATAMPDENGSSCYCMLGFAWNGTECVELGDCRCAGSDCDKLTQTVEECQQAHAACR